MELLRRIKNPPHFHVQSVLSLHHHQLPPIIPLPPVHLWLAQREKEREKEKGVRWLHLIQTYFKQLIGTKVPSETKFRQRTTTQATREQVIQEMVTRRLLLHQKEKDNIRARAQGREKDKVKE